MTVIWVCVCEYLPRYKKKKTKQNVKDGFANSSTKGTFWQAYPY